MKLFEMSKCCYDSASLASNSPLRKLLYIYEQQNHYLLKIWHIAAWRVCIGNVAKKNFASMKKLLHTTQLQLHRPKMESIAIKPLSRPLSNRHMNQNVARSIDETASAYTNGYVNMGASLDSVVTQQPINNNHLPPRDIGREINELPINADKLYEVFSKSLIFRDEHELKKSSTNSLDELETKSEPDFEVKPNRTKVYFEDEVNSPVTDFEIMFKDELASHEMFKIDEESESVKSQDTEEEGIVMNIVAVKKQDVIKPSTVTMKDENKITIQSSVYNYDPAISTVTLPSTLSIPKSENVKGILRQKTLPRSHSAKTLERIDSSSKLSRQNLNRVESLKAIDPNKLNKVLARVPVRSASFLNIPEHLAPEKPPLVKSKSMVGVLSDSELKLSSLPDTPIIRSNNLPRFFADVPDISEYKNEVSLQEIKQKSESLLKEDYSMPRYYGTISKSLEQLSMHESKSMPDLRNPASTGKVSKRLVKLRSRLKPLVIKKSSDERL